MKDEDLKELIYKKIPVSQAHAIEKMGEDLKLAVALVARLRGPEGCPWDREQDHLTLRPYLIEEAYEVLDVLDEFDPKKNGGKFEEPTRAKIREELGDLLLQVLLHSQLADERGEFSMGNVARAMVEKLVTRHPHVFGDTKVSGSSQVLDNWEVIKKKEKKEKGLLDGLPKNLPSLQRAARIGEKARGVGFDWPDWKGSLEKVDEEIGEVKEAIEGGKKDEIEHELGDLFFAICNLSRHLKIQPEDAHRKAISRFEERFRGVEKVFAERGQDMQKATLAELDQVWEQVKAKAL